MAIILRPNMQRYVTEQTTIYTEFKNLHCLYCADDNMRIMVSTDASDSYFTSTGLPH